jgi:hypothetical protein
MVLLYVKKKGCCLLRSQAIAERGMKLESLGHLADQRAQWRRKILLVVTRNFLVKL